VPRTEAGEWRQRAAQLNITLSTLAHAAWALVLADGTGARDVMFGSVVVWRPPQIHGVDEIIGPMLNSIPVRCVIDEDAPVAGWLRAFQSSQAEARQYDHASLLSIGDWSELPHQTRLFETILTFQNPTLLSARTKRLPIEAEDFKGGWTSFPISLDLQPFDVFDATLSYDEGRITKSAASMLLGRFAFAIAELARATATVGRVLDQIAAHRRDQTADMDTRLVEARHALASSLRQTRSVKSLS
jgi:non-ribosomal peptide synthetase component F